MDISAVSTFDFNDAHLRQEFMMLNGLAHNTYYLALLGQGFSPSEYPIFDLDESEQGRQDWLQIHALMHRQSADLLNLSIVDLSDVDLNNADDFASWLQLHQDAHIELDIALGV